MRSRVRAFVGAALVALLASACGGRSHSATGASQSNSGQSSSGGVTAYCQDYSGHWSDIDNAASKIRKSNRRQPARGP